MSLSQVGKRTGTVSNSKTWNEDISLGLDEAKNLFLKKYFLEGFYLFI